MLVILLLKIQMLPLAKTTLTPLQTALASTFPVPLQCSRRVTSSTKPTNIKLEQTKIPQLQGGWVHIETTKIFSAKKSLQAFKEDCETKIC